MKEFKILIILIVVIGVIYYGVEPYAHSVMLPKVAPADFAFKDLEPMDLKNGDANKGKQLVAENCTAYGIKSQNIPAPMDSLKREQLFWGRATGFKPCGGGFECEFLSPLHQRSCENGEIEP